MRYQVFLKQIQLKEAVDLLLKDLTVFYTFEIGKPLWILEKGILAHTIKNDAIYLTPDSYLEEVTE